MKVVPRQWLNTPESLVKCHAGFFNSGGYYKYMWWGFLQDEDSYDFSAEGDRGQLIYVSPQKKLIIERNGFTYGDVNWWKLAFNLAGEITKP